METTTSILLIAFMAITVIVLATGFVVMIRGGKTNKKYGNKLMVARVAAQALALAMLAILFYISRS